MKKKVVSRAISGLLTFCLVVSMGMPTMQTSAVQLEENITQTEEKIGGGVPLLKQMKK